MKKPLCIILSVLFLLSLTACGGKTIYFDDELAEEERFLEQTTVHFPLKLTCADDYGDWQTSLNIAEDGSFSGSYNDPDYGDSGDGFENGTIYTCTFTGEFANFEVIDDYTIKMYCYNLEFERELGEEWIDVEQCIRRVSTEPHGLSEDESGFTLYTPDAPKVAVPAAVVSSLGYDTSASIGIYALVNNKTGEVFTEQSTTFPPTYYGLN